MPVANSLTVTVIIVTFARPLAVERCLKQLHEQTVAPHQIIVVDGDDNEEARPICAAYEDVIYVRNPNGFGRMTGSRNLGLLHSTGDIVAYIDDDAYAFPEFVDEIASPYADPQVGAVGGRAIMGHDGEETYGVDAIGQITKFGVLLGNFAADPKRIIEVEHLIGCNMSFRADILGELGGFHEYYPGFCSTYEEADLCFRLKKLGYKILFNPKAVVFHEGAPRKVGNRFDAPYQFRVARNHATMLVRNAGIVAFMPWKFALLVFSRAMVRPGYRLIKRRPVIEMIQKSGAQVAGVTCGLVGGIIQRLKQGNDLRRRDKTGLEITKHLINVAKNSVSKDASDLAHKVRN